MCSSNINMTLATLPYHIRLATEVAISRDRMICDKRLVISQRQYIIFDSSRWSCMCEHWLMTKRSGGDRPSMWREGCYMTSRCCDSTFCGGGGSFLWRYFCDSNDELLLLLAALRHFSASRCERVISWKGTKWLNILVRRNY